ncbi:MAG TPA: sulfite exporter TauE/SafE family protein [Longimicrobiales bacterium]|nr:sulfite exporter TauE/SafE family protein [Longimicrobiales bacterium]
MTVAALLALAVVGFAVGFTAGLIGVGGGVLIVPFLYFFYGHAAWSGVLFPDSLHTTVAHATSLFIIVPTAIAGTITYTRAGLVEWRAVIPIAAFSTLAAAGGALLAIRIPGEYLKVGFGVFLLFTAAQLLRRRGHGADGPLRLSMAVTSMTGVLAGVLASLLGVGGGLVVIPLLLNVVRLNVERVAATSLAIVVVAATSGTLTYMVAGAGLPDLPPGSLGFVHVAAALPMLPGAMIAVRWGARTNQRMEARRLRQLFALFFAVLGARLVLTNLGPLLQL